MKNSFIIDPGVVIADQNLGVAEAKIKHLIQESLPTTNIQKVSRNSSSCKRGVFLFFFYTC